MSGPFFIVLDPDEEKNLDETSNQPTLHKTAGMQQPKEERIAGEKKKLPIIMRESR